MKMIVGHQPYKSEFTGSVTRKPKRYTGKKD